MLVRKIRFLFCLIACISFIYNIQAQSNFSNRRSQELTLDSNFILLDSLLLIPETVLISDLSPDDYSIDYQKSALIVKNEQLLGRKIHVAYRVFDFKKNLFKPKRHKSQNLIQDPLKTYQPPDLFELEDFSVQNDFFSHDLQSNGSISRGISVGNNQDLSLQSSLNLQLSGFLSDDIEILANITDQNIPLQADGTTHNLQDFNKIFINLRYKKQFSLTAGDIEPSTLHDEYLKINKRLLGLEFQANNTLDSNSHLRNVVGGGVAKGKYVTQKITAVEGVQGPYKLYGKNGETHLVILSGSERVYIDGRLLERGQDRDYTIDYNTGEITFSARHLITTETRITVEFEYSDYAYTRYALYTFNEFTHERNAKLKFKVNFYHEQDLKNQSIEPELDDTQKWFLAGLGDRTQEAFYHVADTAAFSTNEILYHRLDTIVEGIPYSPVYVHATDGSQTCYRLKFSFKGENQGNYILSQSSANGRVFQWVAPKGGIPQGNYEPVIALATPKLSQMGSITAEYDFLENSGIKVEWAISNQDQNTFSKHDDGDNVGFAGKVSFFHQNALKKRKKTSNSWNFFTQADYEFTHKNFRAIENYRDIEFDRIYNLTGNDITTHQQMLHLNAGFRSEEVGSIRYDGNWFSKSQTHNALRNELSIQIRHKGWWVNSISSFLFSNDSIQKTQFVKTDNVFSKSFKRVEIGAKENLEYNLFRCQQSDTLRPNSYAFNEVSLFVKNNDSSNYKYEILFKNRIDHTTQDRILSLHSIAYEAGASFEISQIKNQRLRGNATFRQLNALDSNRNWVKDNNFVGSLEYTGRFCKNAIIFTTYYEAGGGLEPKRSFSFLKVAAGQGTHVWRDYNGNGLEDLDEFEIAVFQDEADYIKVWLTGNEYVSTFNNKLTQSLQLRPGAVWSQKHGLRKALSMFANTTTFRAGQKNMLKNSANAFNPFYTDIADSLLVSQNMLFKNDLSFSTPKHYFGFDFSIQKTQNKNLLYYGAESTDIDLQDILFKTQPHQSLTIKTDYEHSVKRNRSAYFTSRTYQIEEHKITQSYLWNWQNKWSMDFLYTYSNKKNISNVEKCTAHRFEITGSYRMPQKGTLSLKIEYANLRYGQLETGTLAYEMAEGLQNGHNGLWSLAFERNISDFLQLSLLYDGRISETAKTIHSGHVQLKAYF